MTSAVISSSRLREATAANSWVVVVSTGFAMFAAFLDTTIFVIAFAAISADFPRAFPWSAAAAAAAFVSTFSARTNEGGSCGYRTPSRRHHCHGCWTRTRCLFAAMLFGRLAGRRIGQRTLLIPGGLVARSRVAPDDDDHAALRHAISAGDSPDRDRRGNVPPTTRIRLRAELLSAARL
jgi:hypothetical protein